MEDDKLPPSFKEASNSPLLPEVISYPQSDSEPLPFFKTVQRIIIFMAQIEGSEQKLLISIRKALPSIQCKAEFF